MRFDDGDEGFVDVSAIRAAGIYLLLWKGEVVYVGQSRTVYQRVYQHIISRGKLRKVQTLNPKPKLKIGFAFDQVLVRACSISELDGLERKLIAKYKPKHNIQHNPTPIVPLNELILTLIGPPKPVEAGIRRRV